MKKTHAAIIAAVAFLAGVGCTALVMQSKNNDKPETESTGEVSTASPETEAAAETEAPTDAETEVPASNEETESESLQVPIGIPHEDVQVKSFYQMIEKELIPQYGLSDLAGFDEDGTEDNTYLVKAIPDGTQGIIGARISDFESNAMLECVVLRAEADKYVLDYYNPDHELTDTYIVHSFTPDESITATDLTISIVNQCIVITKCQSNMPGYSSYGTGTVILGVTEEGGFTERLTFGGSRRPASGVNLYVNSETLQGDESLEGDDFADLRALLETELAAIGMTAEVIRFGWDVKSDLNYGIEVDFGGEVKMLFEDAYENGLTCFKDHTGLRDTIS